MSDREARRHPPILWEGPLFETQSLALVNRALCSRLLERGVELALQPFEAIPDSQDETLRSLAARVGHKLPDGAAITVRHQWPPDLSAPVEGRLVLIQPWEFGSLPCAWIDPIDRVVDEVWAYTASVRECYLRSGVDPERLHFVPLGVDVRRFRPDVEPLPLRTRGRFRFLFVGGTIHRKGIDILLGAYAKAFGPDDDVCLVIKAMGSETSYRGQQAGEAIEAFIANPATPELLYLDDELDESEMPRLYAAADCLVHPYRGEGFGLPIAEAMACALPVVVTDRGAARAFCEEAWSYLVPSQELVLPNPRVGDLATVARPTLAEPDVEALVGILRRVRNDPAEARRRGFAAREQIRTRFSWEHAVDAVLARCDALAACTDPPRASRPVAAAGSAAIAEAAPRPPIVWSAAPFNYSGYAKISRTLLPAVERAGQPVQLKAFGTDERFVRDFEARLGKRPEEALLWDRMTKRRATHGVGVCLHPPVSWDGHRFFRAFQRESPGLDAYVGFTMFETDRLPRGWAAECNTMDEVWVPSELNREIFADSGVRPEKLRVFQPGIDVEPFRAVPEALSIPNQRGFTFLSVFEWTRRKGWDVLLDAWARAFAAGDDVRLVLRAYAGGSKGPSIRERIDSYLRERGHPADHCAPIVVTDDFIPDEQMPALYAAANAYLMPSRGEGWGRPAMEAMACGLPVVATGWSGNTEFMNADNSTLLAHSLVRVEGRHARDLPHYRGHRWAEPDPAHLRACLREMQTAPDAARARGDRGRREVLARFDRRLVACQIQERLDRVGMPAHRTTPNPHRGGTTWAAP